MDSSHGRVHYNHGQFPQNHQPLNQHHQTLWYQNQNYQRISYQNQSLQTISNQNQYYPTSGYQNQSLQTSPYWNQCPMLPLQDRQSHNGFRNSLTLHEFWFLINDAVKEDNIGNVGISPPNTTQLQKPPIDPELNQLIENAPIYDITKWLLAEDANMANIEVTAASSNDDGRSESHLPLRSIENHIKLGELQLTQAELDTVNKDDQSRRCNYRAITEKMKMTFDAADCAFHSIGRHLLKNHLLELRFRCKHAHCQTTYRLHQQPQLFKFDVYVCRAIGNPPSTYVREEIGNSQEMRSIDATKKICSEALAADDVIIVED
ncbi:hypothetical protein Bhyg_01140 [Pseudolycoriella hygida]|uniref:Uncharacterized protein n=1 Tax=Pseudolycoriella hygida TaxID=35572 RepID=A0A9Q0NAM5_9DIPT|nr:hypothetical protein Bhyg_01140 [Pseudolycoriella hygida]